MTLLDSFKNRLLAVPLALIALVMVAATGAVLAENVDPSGNNSQFAYGENAGWLNAEPAGCTNCGVHVGATGLTGYMWGENTGWINMSCQNAYGPACVGSPGGNWGVAKSASGVLSGYAWSESAGWISMSCSNLGACGTSNYGAAVNPADGVFAGNAWSENLGWISFSDTTPVAYKVQTVTDADNDGVLADADNCPTTTNPLQENADGDPFGDACEIAACVNFATVWSNPVGDDDCDGFPSVTTVAPRGNEGFMGTDPNDRCPSTTTFNDELIDAWPPDFNDSRRVDLSDLGMMGASFNKTFPDPLYNPRFDLNASNSVNLSDLGILGVFFNKSCTP